MIKIAFMGDIFPGGDFVYEGSISEEVNRTLSKYDLRVANLESALYNGKAECRVKMSDPKLGNLVFSPEKCVNILKELNIDVVSLANNHIFDCDYEGLARTIELLDQNNIGHFGAGRDEEETRKPAIVTIKGKTVCLLGYFPPEWEAPYPPCGETGGLNQLIISNVIDDIKKYKEKYDYVFVMPHWGKEHTIFPLNVDIDRMNKMVTAGVTGILGSHTHIVQSCFIYKNTAIAMSMGNLIFPNRFIVPPRKTYYPSEKERMQTNIPVTEEFPIVDKLTKVNSKHSGRIGMICEISIIGSNIAIMPHYTYLDSKHVLKLYSIPFIKRVELEILHYLFIGNMQYVYYLINHVFNKIASIIGIKKRIGVWDAK